jgi:glycosyltransferase involved in cell wall biosynthesis
MNPATVQKKPGALQPHTLSKGKRIAIIGTRGIPNRYGGFEQISETLAEGLVQRGHAVTVYCSGSHPDHSPEWKGVRRILCPDPEETWGTFGQFLYDRNCIRHARKEEYDALLFMGYTSSSVWGPWFPKRCAILSNMDGLEWKRTKYGAAVRRFLRQAESWAVRFSHRHIADSPVIKTYLQERYGIDACYIPYGATVQESYDPGVPYSYGLVPDEYFMLMARMEPENHVMEIVEGYADSGSKKKLLLVGNMSTPYGKKILDRFGNHEGIVFTGGLFDQEAVHALRAQAALYFHGHSVGGTNPSLLEAMGSGALIAAHRNPFNESILESDGFYFSSPAEVAGLMQRVARAGYASHCQRHQERIRTRFAWEPIIDQYETLILETIAALK